MKSDGVLNTLINYRSCIMGEKLPLSAQGKNTIPTWRSKYALAAGCWSKEILLQLWKSI